MIPASPGWTTERSFSGPHAAVAEVEGVADAVADQVDRQHDDQQRDAWVIEEPGPGRGALDAVGHEATERGLAAVAPDAEAEIGERGLEDDRRRRGERR